MDHLAQDLSVALEESESCGPVAMQITKRWGMRRRTRSAGNLHSCIDRYLDNHTDESSSGESENRLSRKSQQKFSCLRHSDSDDTSMTNPLSNISAKSDRSQFKRQIHNFMCLQRHNGSNRKSSCCGLESDSFNENSPARPSIRRKRKLKRMCVDEAPVLPNGKRKRPQRIEPAIATVSNSCPKIKPLNQSVVDKIEKFCQDTNSLDDSACGLSVSPMESSFLDLNVCDGASESSLSWSGGEGHEGDDELTDWAPPPEPLPTTGEIWGLDGPDIREFRAGCRRVRDERPGYSIASGANEKIARFLQDASRSELRLFEGERDALVRLAKLYSLEWWEEDSSLILRKTGRTQCMQPPQRHHTGYSIAHKKIRTHETRPT